MNILKRRKKVSLFWMALICVLNDLSKIYEKLQFLFKKSSTNIYLSLPHNDIIEMVENNSNNVFILTNNQKIKKKGVKVVENFGPRVKDELAFLTETSLKMMGDDFKDQSLYSFNQSYIYIENQAFIFGCGVIGRPGPTLFIKSDQEIKDFVKLNWRNGGTLEKWNKARLVGGPEYEHNLIIEIIESSTKFLYIETTNFISHTSTKNAVADHLIKRLKKIKDEHDPFQCIIKINPCVDELFESSARVKEKIKFTLEYILNEIGESEIDYSNHIFFCQTEDGPPFTFIVNDEKCLMTTSKDLSDRSLYKDINLGVVFDEKDHVKLLSKQILLDDKPTIQHFQEHYKQIKSWAMEIAALTMEPKNIKTFKQNEKLLQYLLGECCYGGCAPPPPSPRGRI